MHFDNIDQGYDCKKLHGRRMFVALNFGNWISERVCSIEMIVSTLISGTCYGKV